MNGVMIALLPYSAEWTNLEFPHMTVVYAGDVGDHKITDLPKLIKDASSIAMVNRPLTLMVTGLEVFGKDDEKVDVFTLRPIPEIMAIRNFVEKWHKSEFTEYRPHVTVGPSPSMVVGRPQYITFDKVAVAWGDEKYIFKMSS